MIFLSGFFIILGLFFLYLGIKQLLIRGEVSRENKLGRVILLMLFCTLDLFSVLEINDKYRREFAFGWISIIIGLFFIKI